MAQQFKNPADQANAMNSGELTINQKRRKPLEDYVPTYWREFKKGDYSGVAKVFDEPSQYGINGGRVSKLWLEHKGQPILNYDRGWDTKTGKLEIKPEHEKFYNELLTALEAAEKWRQ